MYRNTVDDINPALPITLKHGKYGLVLIMGHAGFIPSTVVYTLAPKFLYRDYLVAKVYTSWAHEPLKHHDFFVCYRGFSSSLTRMLFSSGI